MAIPMNVSGLRASISQTLRETFERAFTPEGMFEDSIKGKKGRSLWFDDWRIAELAVEFEVDPEWALSKAASLGVLRE